MKVPLLPPQTPLNKPFGLRYYRRALQFYMFRFTALPPNDDHLFGAPQSKALYENRELEGART